MQRRAAALVLLALAGPSCTVMLDPDDLGTADRLSVLAPALIEGHGAFGDSPGVPIIVSSPVSMHEQPPSCTLSADDTFCAGDRCRSDAIDCDRDLCQVEFISDDGRRAGLEVRLPVWEQAEDAELTVRVSDLTATRPVQWLPEKVLGADTEVAYGSVGDQRYSCVEVSGGFVTVAAPAGIERGSDPVGRPVRIESSAGFVFRGGGIGVDAQPGVAPGPGGHWGGPEAARGYGDGGGHGESASGGPAAHATLGTCEVDCPPPPSPNGIYNAEARLRGGSGGGGVGTPAQTGGSGGGAIALLTPGALVCTGDECSDIESVRALGSCDGLCGSSGTIVLRAHQVIGAMRVNAQGQGNGSGIVGGGGRLRTEIATEGDVGGHGNTVETRGPAFSPTLSRITGEPSFQVELSRGSAEYPLLLRAGNAAELESTGEVVSVGSPATLELGEGLNQICTQYPETPVEATVDSEPESFHCITVAYIPN